MSFSQRMNAFARNTQSEASDSLPLINTGPYQKEKSENVSISNNLNQNLSTESSLNYKKLSSISLLTHLKELIYSERRITNSVLECINEIELRKIHLESGYSSLFDFLTLGMGYSPAAAQRRIDGARLLRQLPEIAPKIEQGHINLSQISLLQKTIRNYQRDTSLKINLKQKKELLNKIANRNFKESELILAQELNLPIPSSPEIKQLHKDESQSITIHFSKEEIETLDQVKNLKSNAIGSLDYKSLFLFLAKQELKKYQKMHRDTTDITSDKEVENKESILKEASGASPISKLSSNPNPNPNTNTNTDLTAATSKCLEEKRKTEIKFSNDLYKPVPRGIYKTILKPGSFCEYRDPVTKKICGSKAFLQVDHIKPRWAFHHEKDKSSVHHKENLRVLCGNHNKLVYHLQKSLKTTSE